MTTINKEFIYKQTPYDLAVFAVDFGTRRLENNPFMWQQNTNATLPYMIYPRTFATDKDVNPITIAMVIDDPNPLMQGYLNAQKLNGRTLVTGVFQSEDWELYRERYESLYNELTRLGLIESPTMQAQSPAPTDAAKTPKWTTDRIAFETYKATVKMLRTNYVSVIFAILGLVVAVLTLLFSQGVFQNSTYAATPTLTPTLVSPSATP